MSTNTPNPEARWFGDTSVDPDEKTSRVEGVFGSVAARYDIMNDLMSGGVHRLWKDHFIRKIRPRPGLKYLDVAGGTGDIALRIAKRVGPESDITVCDLSPAMLEAGQNRAIDRGYLKGLRWITGNAEKLPFPDDSFDVYTISFGLRNVTHIDDALKEAARVLKPGGRFYCLEFSRVEEPFLAKLYDVYSDMVIPRLGQAVANDRESYQYLVESIRRFPSQKALARRMIAAGLKNARFENLTFGVAAIHEGLKV